MPPLPSFRRGNPNTKRRIRRRGVVLAYNRWPLVTYEIAHLIPFTLCVFVASFCSERHEEKHLQAGYDKRKNDRRLYRSSYFGYGPVYP